MKTRAEIVQHLTALLDRKPHVTEVNLNVGWLRMLLADPADVDQKEQPTDATTKPARRKRTPKPEST